MTQSYAANLNICCHVLLCHYNILQHILCDYIIPYNFCFVNINVKIDSKFSFWVSAGCFLDHLKDSGIGCRYRGCALADKYTFRTKPFGGKVIRAMRSALHLHGNNAFPFIRRQCLDVHKQRDIWFYGVSCRIHYCCITASAFSTPQTLPLSSTPI